MARGDLKKVIATVKWLKSLGYVRVRMPVAQSIDSLLSKLRETPYTTRRTRDWLQSVVPQEERYIHNSYWVREWVLAWWILYSVADGYNPPTLRTTSANVKGPLLVELKRSFRDAKRDPEMQKALIGERDLWDGGHVDYGLPPWSGGTNGR